MTSLLNQPDLLDQQNDLVFKVLLQRHELLLGSMLEAVLAEPIAEFTVLNPEIPGDLPGHKSIIVDILVRLADGRRVNVEMQVNSRPELRPRLAYYVARNLSDQLVRGDNYALVCPSILVVWLVEPLFRDIEQFHSIFELRERSTHVAFGPELTMHLLQLSKLKSGAATRAAQHSKYAELEGLWGRFFTAKTRLDFVQLRAQHPIMSQAGLQQGREQGLQQGLADGREQGLEEGQATMLLRLLELKFGSVPAELTARVRAASQNDVTRWGDRLFQAATLSDVFGE